MKKISLVLLIALLALGFRLWAVSFLPIDYDEDDYLAAGQRYAQAMRQGDWQFIIDYDYNYEHPPLTKLVYAWMIVALPEAPLLPESSPALPPASSLPQPHFHLARLSSAVFGSLEVLGLALLNPLAGFFLAAHTWTVKYTSQIMLEPLPALTSLVTALCYIRWKRSWMGEQSAKANGWLWLSALFLGITAASKYTYCVVGLAILGDWLWDVWAARRSGAAENPWRNLALILAWGAASVALFVVFDPRMWHDPLGRLGQSLLYHGNYATSDYVRRAGFPTWQPLVWLAGPVLWHPGAFFLPLDFYTFLLAIFGLRRAWQKQRVIALWLVMALVVLLLWPTKWPQYILILTAPLCLAAAEGFQIAIWEPLRGWLRRWRRSSGTVQENTAVDEPQSRQGWPELRRVAAWLLPGAVVLTLIALFPLIYQSAMAVTDFNATSFRDGLQGGVWRAVWQGLSGQEKAVQIDVQNGVYANTVHYAGLSLLWQLLLGMVPEVLVFDVLWTVLSVGLQTTLGLGAALLLNRRGVRFAGFWRAIFILPWAIPEFVGALIWLRVLEPRTGWLAISQQLPAGVLASNWLESADQTLLHLLVAATWYGFPFIMLAAAAGLKMIPEDVYDAAAIDGANLWNTFRYVTWPLLFPLLAPAVIIRAIFAFNQFYLFYTFRVDFSTMSFATLSYLIFSPGYGGQFAISAAVNIFTVLVLIGLILWFSKVSKAAEGVTYA